VWIEVAVGAPLLVIFNVTLGRIQIKLCKFHKTIGMQCSAMCTLIVLGPISCDSRVADWINLAHNRAFEEGEKSWS
jgi:hypothetical protein